jgi:HD-GYP domain-containing protein (c-di-GMP phosphodiesterase class II)/ABC-type amino acid transport substrate-binding protein
MLCTGKSDRTGASPKMTALFGNMRTTIRLTVVFGFIVATALTAGIAIGLQYYFGQSLAKQVASELYSTASSNVLGEQLSVRKATDSVMNLLAENPLLQDRNNETAHIELFTHVLEQNPLFYGIYLGGGDGSFFEVINLDTSDTARKILHAHPSDRWLIITLRKGKRSAQRVYRYLDDKLNVRLSRSEPTRYDPRTRPWFTKAMASDKVQSAEPYLFAQLGVPGRTFSKRLKNSDGVLAVDMTLAKMSEFLNQQKLPGHGDIYIFNRVGEVIASSLLPQDKQSQIAVPKLVLTSEERQFVASQPVLNVSNELNWPPFDYTLSGQPRGYSIDIVNLISQMTGLQLRFTNGYSWPQLVDLFHRGEIDLLQSVVQSKDNQSLGLLGSSYAELPVAIVTRDDVTPPSDLSQLNGQRLAIPAGWSSIPIVREHYPQIEIVETESTLNALELVTTGEVAAALDSEAIVRYLAQTYFLTGLQINKLSEVDASVFPTKMHIAVHAGQPELRALIDKAIAAIGKEQFQYLSDTWLQPDKNAVATYSNVVPTDALIQAAANQAMHNKIFETQLAGETYLAYVAPNSDGDNPYYIGMLSPRKAVVAPFLDHVNVSILLTSAFLLLLLPFTWFFANPIVRPIKQLALENDKVQRREYANVKRVTSNVSELDELSGSMVSMVAAIQAHEIAQYALMDSFIELIAQAIDDKSAYTGSHCKRVPELALMLAEHASASDHPAFRDFNLNNEDQWREYRIAAWLHDCGKITTPEHIVDKGSKLETIYNRIHEVRMRFEVLWRDAEIAYCQQRIEHPEMQAELAQQLAKEHNTLLEEYAFVASCNVGGESLGQDKLDRLRDIAKKSWLRHFDDRIGLSPLEELRLVGPAPSLPAPELLLTDKPEHIIPREHAAVYPPEFGINMNIPEHLYNLGEIYNLSVSRGTLTAEDRFKINEHMISTIKMLESLPFPEELKNVPRYASTHHETMKGTGYPRKLPGSELSIPERLLAVADVFEALTASDRPYKKAKSISEAMDILHKMVLDNHIDKDCFQLFVREKVYLRYAREYLSVDQIDTVHEDKYLAC